MFGHTTIITNTNPYEGISPAGFLRAVREGNFEIVSRYIEQGRHLSGDLDVRDSNGQTATSIAAEKGYLKILNAVIDAGADLNIPDKNNNETALYKAVKSGNHEVVHAVAAGRDIDFEVVCFWNTGCNTALRLAVEKGNAEIVEILISHGAKIKDYHELLEHAKRLNHAQVIEYLSENKISLIELSRRQYDEDCSESDSDDEQDTSDFYMRRKY